MRPDILNTYRPSFPGQLRLWVTRQCFGLGAWDASRAALYRPQLFSRRYYAMQDHALRGRSVWTSAERELFASRIAAKMRCEYCRVSHGAFAARAERKLQSGDARHQEHADINRDMALSAISTFLEKLTETPWDIHPADITALYHKGLSNDAIREAVAVCVVFNIGSRLSLALDLRTPGLQELRRAAPLIRMIGYRLIG